MKKLFISFLLVFTSMFIEILFEKIFEIKPKIGIFISILCGIFLILFFGFRFIKYIKYQKSTIGLKNMAFNFLNSIKRIFILLLFALFVLGIVCLIIGF